MASATTALPRPRERRKAALLPGLVLLATAAVAVLAGVSSGQIGGSRGSPGAFLFGGKKQAVEEPPKPAWLGVLEEHYLHARDHWLAIGLAFACLTVFTWALVLYVQRLVRQSWELQRPYKIRDVLGADSVPDPEAEFRKVIAFIQDTVLRPIDERLPGRPFEYDLHTFPFTPMVLVIGNHSSGKSTFVNRLLGIQAQETGVAPTDDGFTILERAAADEAEDGPTVLGCPENRPFRELQRFGQAFSGHLKRKRVCLSEDSKMPFGLQVVDTPGMIDLPANTESNFRGRGYNFVEVVRWWAKRADLVLLLFDPDKPGTTGETLDVLTKALAGLDHKFLVILNKVDQLDNSVDFARAYGALGWALSKVIRRKDIPNIYTMQNAGFDGAASKDHKLPLDAFAKKRQEVVDEVLRAKGRHNDNVVTALEETLRQLAMVAKVLGAIRWRLRRRLLQVQIVGFLALISPPLGFMRLVDLGMVAMPGHSVFVLMSLLYLGICFGVCYFLREYLRQCERLQAAQIDSVFEEVHADAFIHTDGEDLHHRWQVVRPRIEGILQAVPSAAHLPQINSWELGRIHQLIDHDTWYLRQLARLLRAPVPPADSAAVRKKRRDRMGDEH